MGTRAGWHQTTGGWTGREGVGGLAFIRVSLCREYAADRDALFGLGLERGQM